MQGFDFVRKVELFLKKGRLTVKRIVAVYEDRTRLGFLQAAKKSQQGGLPYSVLTEEAVNASFGDLH